MLQATDAVIEPASGIRGLLAIPAFRGIAIANVLSAVAVGTSRFVFVWLIGDLTGWDPAIAILGVVIGLPPLFLSAWAGSLVDRLDPRRLGLGLLAATSTGFTVTAALVQGGAMTVPLAMVCAFASAIAPSMLVPLLQALVPTVVPGPRLMQGVAIQNLGMMVSMISGAFIGGGVIQAFGTAAGFWFLAIASGLGALRYAMTPLPNRLAGATAPKRGAVRDGARLALGTQPLRSLLALTSVIGLATAASMLMTPEIARDVLGRDSFAAGALNACMGVGMMITSFVIATRWTPSRPGLLLLALMGTFLGGGLVAIGLSRAYALTALVVFLWGATGGIVMTLLRTLTQLHTPPDMMGRVMGLAAMAQNGAFPIGALVLFGLVAVTSLTTATVIAGIICAVCVWVVAIGPAVRGL